MALGDCEAREKANLTRCGLPIDLAYHTDTDGWWRVTAYKCHACSAGQEKPVYHEHVDLDPEYPALVPFELDVTTEIQT